jgi:hypothetical protein
MRWLARAGVAGVVVVCIVLWVYVFLIADPKPTDQLRDKAFVAAAQPICKSARDQIYGAGLYGVKADTPQQRGALVDRADAILKAMVQQLRAVPAPNDATDARIVSGWLADWDGYLADRDAWVAKLAAGNGDAFFERTHEGGEPASKTMDEFAIANNLEDCKTPDNY